MIAFSKKFNNLLMIIIFAALNSGCTSLSYYSQSIQGQWDVISKSKDIETLIKDPTISTGLREKLKLVLRLRRFSIQELGMPDNKSYLAYSDLGREYVVWNIFATEEFSLQPKQWCFLFVGCLQYRGYFNKQTALRFAKQLESEGMDVYSGGVSAYSTLGWFNDPVLNTMLNWSETRLAAVMFHELTHQRLYIKDDTEFNESLADAVAIIGVRRWLIETGQNKKLTEYESFLEREKQFVSLVLKYKDLLEKAYSTDVPSTSKRQDKKRLFDAMRQEYMTLSRTWEKDYYGKWLSSDLNNASLASVVSYRKHVDVFLSLFETTGQHIHTFFEEVNRLSMCSFEERMQILSHTEGTLKIDCNRY